MGWLYHLWGENAEAGNNLIFDQIHETDAGVPRRMAPLVLVTTVLTHLCGGSAGREGTAVQMGGSLASGFAKLFHFPPDRTRLLLMAGVAAAEHAGPRLLTARTEVTLASLSVCVNLCE